MSIRKLLIQLTLVLATVTAYSDDRTKTDACINYLRQMDGAINQWALENNKTNGALPTMADIKPYLKLDANGELPPCPAGGTYTLHPVGSHPQVTCSIPGHVLPY